MTDKDTNLPTYFETIHSLPIDDRKVEILTLELQSLPQYVDEMEIKKELFNSHHVIKIDTQKDNITGLCNGKGHVQIRCSDPAAQKAEIIDRLKKKGIQAAIRSKMLNERPQTPQPNERVNKVKSFRRAKE